MNYYKCRNPILRECENETHTPKIGTPKILEFDCRGQNTSHWGAFYIIESYQSVDVENGLVWAIWASTTQVMAKRKVGNQIDSLTPNH